MTSAAPDITNTRIIRGLPPITDESRAIVSRAFSRRVALMGDMALLRQRYDVIMRWLNPPWDVVSERVSPEAFNATAERVGRIPLHVDLVGQVVDRWAVLEAGAPVIFRCKPKYVEAPPPSPDSQKVIRDRQTYDIDRAIAQNQSSEMENFVQDWSSRNDFDRTILWAMWAKRAFGKGIIRTGWDEGTNTPTAELMENPSQVYYAWTKRYGARRLAWTIVLEQWHPAEVNRRFGYNLPVDTYGAVDMATWVGMQDEGEMDQRVEQQQAKNQMVYVEEFWELVDRIPDGTMFAGRDIGGKRGVTSSLIIGGRVVEGPFYYPWKRVPFHVIENNHIPTFMHSKSTAEMMIPLNAAYDRLLDKQDQVIDFESGPRYKGMNLANSGDDVDIPGPFEMIPLREGEDIQQLDVRVDFYPSQVQADEIREATHRSTGLTPIAWGMSPNAQTSGRAMSAEWRAVELPLTLGLVNASPEIKAIYECWWEYAEAYDKDARRASYAGGTVPYRRFQVNWAPLDIRDKTEKSTMLLNMLQANVIDPETVIEEMGYENVDEIIAKIRSYLMDPVWNPLRTQQLLTLQQLELSIQQQALQVQAQQAAQQSQQGAGAAPGSPEQAQGQQTAGPTLTEGQNQPGAAPGGTGIPASPSALPIQSGIMSQNDRGAGGITDRLLLPLGGGATPPPGSVPGG